MKAVKQLRNDCMDDYLIYYEDNLQRIREQADVCRASEQGIKDHLDKNLKDYVNKQLKEDQVLLKDWTKHIVADQVRLSQTQLREWFNRQLNDVKRLFFVPGFIGDKFP